MKILIIKLGALGDVLRTTFIVHGFKEKWPNCHITWLTKGSAKPLLLNNQFIDSIVEWDERKGLVQKDWDWLISLDDEQEVCNFAATIKNNKTRCKKFQGAYTDYTDYTDGTGQRKYTDDTESWFGMGILRPEEKGGIQKANELKAANRRTFQDIYASIIGIDALKDKKPIFNFTLDEMNYGQNILDYYNIQQTHKVIGINSGAAQRWLLKMLSVEKIAEVCHALAENKRNSILLLGGIDERERNFSLKKLCHEKNIFFVEPTKDIRKFAGIINICDLVITSDSLALHIALALEKKTIAYFGPTSPWEIDMFGLGKKVFKESDCLCCYKQTTTKKPSCIEMIESKDIITPAEAIIRQLMQG